MNKKGNSATVILLLSFLAILGIGTVLTLWMLGYIGVETTPPPTTGTPYTPPSTVGDIVSFKLSSQDNSDSPSRYAGTAYCWNPSTPTDLKGGGSITLSASASTSVPSVTRGEQINCIAFDSTHYGVITPFNINKEADDKLVDTLNTSNANDVTLWEDNQKETENKLIVPAGSTDKFSAWSYKANVADKGFNLKEVCFSSNATSSSELSKIEVEGLNYMSSVPYAYRNTHKYCYALSTAKYIEDYNEEIYKGIRVTTSSSFSVRELVNMTFIDEAYFKSVDGSIKLGIEDDTTSPADVGTSNPSIQFNVSAS